MTEHRTGIDALVHHDGSGGNAHTHHTPDREVGTGQHNQTGHAQGQEHPWGRLLEDIEHVVCCQQGNALDDWRDDAEGDKNHGDCQIQAVAQQEAPEIEGVLVIFPPLGHGFGEREL